jgi:lipopolysaccharide/colanic/teichoic acid biosynthesis glycosyltransferase
MLKRGFDLLFSITGLLLLSPLFLLISLFVGLGSKGGVFYKQKRVGRNEKEFTLFKFRTMYLNSDKLGLLTIGGKDPRVTSAGHVLRRYKLDELPQLLNVLNGTMSFVGPRPEVKKYVDLYTPEQKKALTVKPGITDYASLAYFEENELLGKAADPEATYINEIMPAKLELNRRYLEKKSLLVDIGIILKTLARIVRSS